MGTTIDYEGIWKTTLRESIFLNIKMMDFYLYRRNAKVYQILIKFPEMGDVLFCPIWQRNVDDKLIFLMNWRDGQSIKFILRQKDNKTLFGLIYQDNRMISIECTFCDASLPCLQDNSLILRSPWRYELLCKYRNYQSRTSDLDNISFSYHLINHPLSLRLVNYYHLYDYTSLNDFETMKNIMRWVNQKLSHDGNQDFIGIREANSILGTHPGTASCRGLAIVLCEALLAVGIKCRFVACLPEESLFDECHVVCVAFSKYLGKWLLLDPTNNLFIMDANGIPLDLMEFRSALINNDYFEINNNTNWNGARITKNQYCDYMVKNLICFDCAENYYPGCDQYSKQRITLIPLNYLNETLPNRKITRNAFAFWEYNVQFSKT